MVESLFWVAIGCASIAALMGTRAAWALLAGALIGEVIRPTGVLENWKACATLDLFVIASVLALARFKPLKLEWAILALFVLAWPSYALPDPWKYWGSSAVVIVQLLLTIPLTKLQGIGGFVSHGPIREVKYGDAR